MHVNEIYVVTWNETKPRLTREVCSSGRDSDEEISRSAVESRPVHQLACMAKGDSNEGLTPRPNGLEF